jgi:hypothetical protein
MNTHCRLSGSTRFVLLVLGACGLLPAPSLASDAKEPYQLRIVVHVAPHRLLTDVFREQVAQELRDGLQAALGELARVEVTDKHPLLPEILRQGLERGLAGVTDRSSGKTHFVLIDYRDGLYEIQARQFDGQLGLPGPVVRRDRTRDRALVARVAGLEIEQDLGWLGTVASEPDDNGEVKVDLKAGGLGVPLNRWIKAGDVFPLVRVLPSGAGNFEQWALVRVLEAPKDGVCRAQLFSRYLPGTVVGYRCIKVSTVSGPLRLRLVEELPGGRRERLEKPVQLQIRRHGFKGEDSDLLSFTTDGQKDVDTSTKGAKGWFDGVAFVSVLSVGKVRARVPLVLVDDQLVVLPIPPAAGQDSELLGDRLRNLRRNVSDSFLVQTDLFREINDLGKKPGERSRAIARVRDALARARADHARLSIERGDLAKEMARLPEKERVDWKGIDQQLEQIKAGAEELQKHVAGLEAIEREENDPKRRRWLEEIERARLLEKEFELGQAIEIYERVQGEGFKSDDLTGHLAGLKKLWELAPCDEKFQTARAFIYKLWPGLGTDQLKDRLKDAENALAECRRVGDKVGARKLLKATQTHAARLVKELESLRPDVNAEHEKRVRVIKEVAKGLTDLDAGLRAWLERG